MIPSLEGWPTKAKEAPFPHEVRLAPLDTNPVFHSRGSKRLGSEYASELSTSIFSNYNDRSTNVLNQKRMFSSMSKSFVHIEIIVELKNAGRTIIQINTFVKIGFINNFKSCLLTIRLVS